ncbi:MAG: NADH-quinone oxidoreductase subunit I [Pirellulales bacterium]|nr:NADH-quinone oxidoreductase subunit I [Pirellulales bacterium]
MPINPKDIAWVTEPELGFWEATFLSEVVKGLKITFGHMADFESVTQQYPEQRPVLPQHYRGVHRLNRDEQGRVKCVACMLCATACPAHCISIEAAAAPPDWPDRDKYPAEFILDELRCIYCGMCEEACPVDAIELTHIYDMTSENREAMVFNKQKLLGIFDETKNNPLDPVRTRRGRLGPAAEFVNLATLGPATSVESGDRAAIVNTPGVIGEPPPEVRNSQIG